MWDRQLRKLQRQQKHAIDSDNNRIEKAREAGADNHELDGLMHEAHSTDLYFDDKIFSLQCSILIIRAGRYRIPIPTFDMKSEGWEKSKITERWRLSPSAYAALRSSIEDYEKGRRERIQSWLVVLSGIIGASTGLTGALIGLIAISN